MYHMTDRNKDRERDRDTDADTNSTEIWSLLGYTPNVYREKWE